MAPPYAGWRGLRRRVMDRPTWALRPGRSAAGERLRFECGWSNPQAFNHIGRQKNEHQSGRMAGPSGIKRQLGMDGRPGSPRPH